MGSRMSVASRSAPTESNVIGIPNSFSMNARYCCAVAGSSDSSRTIEISSFQPAAVMYSASTRRRSATGAGRLREALAVQTIRRTDLEVPAPIRHLIWSELAR